MFRRSTVALAVVSALAGCVGAPPQGALVEFRDGLTPITRPSPCEASYVLRPADDPSAPLVVVHAQAGKRVGFRRERDGSVSAIGPRCVVPLENGAYVWEAVPGSSPPWKTRAKQELRAVAKGMGFVSGTAAVLGLESLLQDDAPRSEPGEPKGIILPSQHAPES